MINKHKFSVQNTQKVLHKHGKQWIVISAALLMLLGGGAAMNTVSHADDTNNAQDRTVKVASSNASQPVNAASQSHHSVSAQNSSQDQPSAITAQAKNLHSQIVRNADHNVSQNSAQGQNHQTSFSANQPAQSSHAIVNQAASSVNALAPQNTAGTMTIPAVETENGMSNLAKLQKLYSMYEELVNSGIFSDGPSSDNIPNQPSDNYPSNVPSDNSDVTTGIHDGLTYQYNHLTHTLEFTGGQCTWNGNGSNTFMPSDISDEQSIKIDSDCDFSNVTNMENMFDNNTNLQSITLPNDFNTSNVTNMSDMFAFDNNLQSLNLNNFDTSNVTTMSDMFASDPSLTSLNLSNLDTSDVTNMGGMFSDDTNLQSLTLPNPLDTSNVSDMSDMFHSDNNLPASDIPSDIPNSDLPSDDQSSDNGQPSDTDNPAQQMKEQTLSDINNDRAQYNLAPLQETSDMDSVAQDRANQTASLGYLQHYDNSGNMYETDDANQLGINLGNRWGENLASAGLGNMTMTGDPNSFDNQNGNDMADMDNDDMYNHDQDSGWGHRYNILGSNFTTVGIGVAQGSNGTYYLAEDFGN